MINDRHMIPYGKHTITDSDIQAVINVLKNEYLTQGDQHKLFEIDYPSLMLILWFLPIVQLVLFTLLVWPSVLVKVMFVGPHQLVLSPVQIVHYIVVQILIL